MKGSRVLAGAMAVLAAGAISACAKAQARTQPDRVALEVPPAPPRLVEPIPSDPIVEETPVTMPAAPAPAAPVRPRVTRETPRPEPPPVAAEPEPAPARVAPPRLLTPQTASEAEAERKIRAALARAARDLDSVKTAALNADARAQYETARRFIAQAQEGLDAKNYVFAGFLADKAETIATALVGR
jgi:hypothetical protein